MPEYPYRSNNSYHHPSAPQPRPLPSSSTSLVHEAGPHDPCRTGAPRPTITTAVASLHAPHLHTPASATTLSPFSPYATSAVSSVSSATSYGSSPMSSRNTPTMISAYSPQDWAQRGPVHGTYVPFSSPHMPQGSRREMTGMEGNYLVLFEARLMFSIYLMVLLVLFTFISSCLESKAK